MAEPQEETVGHVADVPPHEKEAPVIQKDVVKENGALPASESLAEIVGKEKEDPTLNSSAPASEVTDIPAAAENGESAIPSEEAKDTDNPSPPPLESSSPSEEAKEAGKTDEEETAVQPTEETAPSPDAPQAEEAVPKSEETEKEPPVETGAEETPVTTKKAQSEEIPETVGPKEAEVEATPKSADTTELEPVADEEPTQPVETAQTEEPKTQLAGGGIPEPVDTPKTDEPKTQPAPEETGEKEAVVVSEEETTKPEEKADEPSDVVTEEAIPKTVDVTETDQPKAPEVAEEEIPKALETIGTEEPSGAEVAADEIPKSVDTTETNAVEPHITEDNTSKPDEADEPDAAQGLVDEKQKDAVDSTDTDEPKAEVISKEADSAADAGEPAPTVEKGAEEPKKVKEGIPEEVPTPAPSPVEQEQPAVEAEEPSKPKSYWGVVLKHVESNGKSESEPKEEDSTSAPSSVSQETDNVHKSPEEVHDKEPVAPLLDDVAEQDIASGDAAASDVSIEKEAGQTEVEEAPKAETKSETKPTEVSPKVLEVNGGAEPSEIATAETPEPMEQDSVDDSSKDAGVPTSEVEGKETPPFISEVSKEISGSVPDETVQESSEGTAGSTEEPKEIPTTTTPEENPESVAEDTTDQLTQEPSLPVKEDAVEEKPAGEDGLPLEKQPSLSVYVTKQGEAAAETPEETTPRGTPLMQRVEHLEQKLAQHENRQSPRSEFTSTGHSTPRSSIDRPIRHSTRYVLEETGSKGTLLDRVAALEQKLAYYLNLHPPSPINDQSITTVAEDLGTEPDSKPAESQTREWSAEGDRTPEQANEETSKAARDAVKPTTDEKSPEDLPAQKEGMAPSRSTSINEKKIKAKAAVGKITGLITGCFSPKKGKPVSASST